MTAASASAPGKILLAGEYAVLEGADAVVMAVDRRAHARAGAAGVLSPFLQAVADVLDEELGPESAEAAAAHRMVVNSSALTSEGGVKLGLGSSAAATVAALAAALGVGGGELDRALVHRLAHHAHREAQSGRGSGADVTASVWGGVLVVRRPADNRGPLEARPIALPAALALVPVWLGTAASTPALLAHMRDFHARNERAYLTQVAALAAPAADLVRACESDDAAAAVAALAGGRRALAELGLAAGIDLETARVRDLARHAEALGGTVKPTGAGGGDVALAAFPGGDAAARFRDEIGGLGIMTLDVGVDPVGVRIEPP